MKKKFCFAYSAVFLFYMYIDENKEEEAIPDRTSARLVYPEGLLLNIFWQGILP